MKRTISSHRSTLELIEHLVQQGPRQNTTLIVCSTRQDFLDQLVPDLLGPSPPSIPNEVPSLQNDEGVRTQAIEVKPVHPLLTPTLVNLATTKSIQLVFCPSITTLRAYLASYASQEPDKDSHETSLRSVILILNLIHLHHGTSEFSLQGLSRSMALAVSATATRSPPISHLELVECIDVHDPSNPAHGQRLWEAQVPLLCGSVRLGGEGATWAGRAISIKRIAGRWFRLIERQEPGQIDAETDVSEQRKQEEVLV